MLSRWPALTDEDRPWTPRVPRDAVSQRRWAAHTGPYRSAVVPRIADLSVPLPSDVVALTEEASLDIARFDAEIGHEIAPFASILLRSESSSSSQIENLTSGAKAIALALLGSRDKRNATAIVANVAAMVAALELADRLDAAAVLTMHEALLAGSQPDIAGRWRVEQVWIGGDSLSPHGAEFVPPHHDHVPALMGDLMRFAARTDLPLLAQAAVAHAQFETVHPFADGNGRTGRTLIHAMLRGHGLTRRVTVPVSAGLLTDTGAYFAALTAYRAGDPVAIITRLAQASLEAATNGRALVAELRTVRRSFDERVRARRDAGVWALADLLLRQPVVDASVVARELAIAPRNAPRVIALLADAGILHEFTGLGRNRMWECREVLDALDAFAARAGRRSARR